MESKLRGGTNLTFQDCIEDRGDSVSTVDMNSDCLSRESVRLWYLYPGQSCVSWGKSLVCKPVMSELGQVTSRTNSKQDRGWFARVFGPGLNRTRTI